MLSEHTPTPRWFKNQLIYLCYVYMYAHTSSEIMYNNVVFTISMWYLPYHLVRLVFLKNTTAVAVFSLLRLLWLNGRLLSGCASAQRWVEISSWFNMILWSSQPAHLYVFMYACKKIYCIYYIYLLYIDILRLLIFLVPTCLILFAYFSFFLQRISLLLFIKFWGLTTICMQTHTICSVWVSQYD